MNDSVYSGKIRVRVAGILIENGKLLLVRLHSPVSDSEIWTPPGGGLEFGESIHEALQREFEEETGLRIEVGTLAYINELLEDPFQAIEFFFRVKRVSGTLILGSDPESPPENQLLKEVRFFNLSEIMSLPLKPDFLANIDWDKGDQTGITPFFKDEE